MLEPVVAIVGRPNVGKSTLFNRFTGRRTAIEDQMPGVTRDRLYGTVNWLGRNITIIDTGGVTFADGSSIETEVHRQVELAIEEASLIVFVVDVVEGLTSLDHEIAAYLRKTKKKILLVANKVDHGDREWGCYPLYELGLGDPFPVSAIHGLGTGDLLEHIFEELPPEDFAEIDEVENLIKVAVVGRPNVGKSSLINTLLGEERVIVTPQPGTTRDAIDVFVDHGGKKFLLVDTAGLRRPSKVKEDVEYYSVLRSIKAIRRADVVLVMLDASEGFAEQDQRIAGMAHEAGKGIIFLLNKWDLVKTAEKGMARRYIDTVHREFAFAHYAPIQFTSVLTGRGIGKLFEMIVKVDDESRKRISTAILNDFLQDVLLVNPPPTRKGRKARILYMTQPETKPPTFIIFVNEARLLHYSYLRYIENRLREAFGFEGVPLRLMVKAKKAIDGGR
ncbi:MAG: ribosome biogenesis GTPase Der [Firmicutes bacterium]|nr:ribosome biogenesis GTPase Der [Bacillota bacterium]